MKRFLVIAVALAVSGCAMVGPDYERPGTPLPTQFEAQAATASPTAVAADWWKVYGDEMLNELIVESFANNADLQGATARVEEADAVLREAHSALVPLVNGQLGAARGRVLGNTPPVGNAFTVGVSASYEIDVWGRLRRGERAAQANLLASRYGRDTVQITLAATVARTYFGVRALDAQQRASQEILDAATESLDLATKRADAGLVPALDIYQAGSLRSTASAQLKEVARLRAALEHQLGVLTGRLDVKVPTGRLVSLPIPPQAPAGLPSQLLERRPDVREAEQRLVSATELIGVARASQFPTLDLTAAFGIANPQISDLFTTGSRFWSVGAGLVGPIIDGGRYAARTDQATAQARQAEASYRKSVQEAFRDVADALSNVQLAQETEVELQHLVEQARQTLTLSRQRYESGYSAYLEVLDAQRTLNDSQIQLIRNRQALLSFTVDLMVALGGGWDPSRA
ncbi:Toluene efflux pump outer membrane protein TtgF [Usitatibacter rugosus]|uniref:Toluene efflux pump outer membrane protein TtgF n=1 Tax=Usitatibacter rugosus TaxID=2732067 RepID=A0A6M4GUI1_9PROT|nr:efflux transporter outer membrane subunit [Usitatibacter rugosus]QJR10655.1 Toluene efflux pump outer membrane protein TtgF [Usitatibacter rugosus]